MKKIIRLTESDLHHIIENSVNRILKEEFDEKMDGIANGLDDEYNDVLNNYEPFGSDDDELDFDDSTAGQNYGKGFGDDKLNPNGRMY